MKIIHVSGKRKTAIARATLKEGSGKIIVNGNSLGAFFPEKMLHDRVCEPLILAGDAYKKYDIAIDVKGGGRNGQADAVRLVIAKSLSAANSALREQFLRYDRHLLVADSRQREPRKPNTHGNARGKVQKSYR
ncbi:MAG: 30S ribosomal protein S9 [Candidatus Woesearchaeota archaeon]